MDTHFKERVHQFFIGLSDAPKYDIIRTENGEVIDSFIPPEILKFKEGSKRVQHVFDIAFFSPENVILRGIRKANENGKLSL